MYHGAALIQIAEHPNFTAINSLKLSGNTIRVAYKINDDIAVYFKYASKPAGRFQEYVFTFTKSHLEELDHIADANSKCYVALVCVKDREVCCLSHAQLQQLFSRRKAALDKLGKAEDSLTVLVTAPKKKSLRIYVNSPGERKIILGKALIVNRNAFPENIFN